VKSLVTSNYIDNCFIEWSNEHDQSPDFSNEFSFGGMTVNGNIFTVNDAGSFFRWFVVTPRGDGHYINGLSVMGNTFRTVNAPVDRIEAVDTTHADLDYARFRNVVFEANTFNGISQITASPVTIEHAQTAPADTWVVDGADYLPFGGRARNVVAVVAEGAITNANNVQQVPVPYVQLEQGSGGRFVNLRWPSDVKGRVHVTLRCDAPV
jgi:hypothetical protein